MQNCTPIDHPKIHVAMGFGRHAQSVLDATSVSLPQRTYPTRSKEISSPGYGATTKTCWGRLQRHGEYGMNMRIYSVYIYLLSTKPTTERTRLYLPFTTWTVLPVCRQTGHHPASWSLELWRREQVTTHRSLCPFLCFLRPATCI